MDSLYLVDGSGYIFRAYYAIQPLSNSKGLATNALFGFTRMMLKLLSDVQAKYIAVTFDTKTPTFRHERYEAYKANRAECPQDLVPQMPYFRDVVRALGVACLEKPGFEADDIIGTITKKLEGRDHRIVIVSGDKDLSQLVNENVEVWDAMRDIHFTPAAVKEKFGVSPDQIIDYLSLIGDTSDNIPGVKGIGPKTAVQLIEHFGSLDKLIQNVDAISAISNLRGAKGIKEKIASSMEVLNLSRELVTLDCAVEPFCSVTDPSEYEWKGVQENLIVPLLQELEFDAILEKLPFKPVPEAPRTEDGVPQNAQYHLVTKEELSSFAQKLSKQSVFAFDTETTSLDVLSCDLVGISISWEPFVSYFVPTGGLVDQDRHLPLADVLAELGPIFSSPNIKKLGFNLKFDVSVLEEKGFRVEGIDGDGMIAWALLHPEEKRQGLKALVRSCLNERMVEFKEVVGDAPNIGYVELDRVAKYACHDADASYRLCLLLEEKLKAEGKLSQAYHEVEMPLVNILSRMERVGVKVDIEFLSRLHEEFSAELAELEQKIYGCAGMEFNINSPKQLSGVLFEHLELPTKGVKKTTNGYSTDASVLYQFAERYPIAQHLIEYREIYKLLTTYVDALSRLSHPKTGRIHSSFNQANVATGRLSSSDPNLQNIPIRNQRGRQIRKAFIADEGKKILKSDYSQIELRVLAHISGDENLIQAFLSDQDIHLATAIDIFGMEALIPERQAELRRYAKTINFGVIYGMGAFRLARDLGITRQRAQQYIDGYFAKYPKVKDYFNSLEEQINSNGYVETIFGRRRYSEGLDTSARDSGYLMRSLNNAPIQGSAADIIKIAMKSVCTALEAYGQDARLILQVHDELVFEIREGLLTEVQSLVVQAMESAVKLQVPLKVDVSIGNSWGG